MKFKALKLIIAAVALMLPLTAQAEKMGIADPARDKYYSALEGKKVAFVPLAMGFDLTEGWYAGMKKALEPLGVEMILRDPNWSADAGSKAISSLISEKLDAIHYALTQHEQLITTGKDEKKLLDAAIKHHESEVRGLRGILERLHGMGFADKNKLLGKNYQINVSPLPDLALEVEIPVEDWDPQDQDRYAMVEEVTTTTTCKALNGNNILWTNEKIKHRYVPNADALRQAHESGEDLPSGVRFIRKYRITRKRILNAKGLTSNVD